MSGTRLLRVDEALRLFDRAVDGPEPVVLPMRWSPDEAPATLPRQRVERGSAVAAALDALAALDGVDLAEEALGALVERLRALLPGGEPVAVGTDPAESAPAEPEPEPVALEPGTPEPAVAEPAVAELAGPEPTAPEPTGPEPIEPEPFEPAPADVPVETPASAEREVVLRGGDGGA
ncbi:Malonyl CoA-acyl carrier protein transacylase [Actinosynnema pretiosum subsp. pretiosum]|nr:Malonyl CoA-acyl carrier protein transacylase [Actinosynnema pretiosum subsp. pretiosum]